MSASSTADPSIVYVVDPGTVSAPNGPSNGTYTQQQQQQQLVGAENQPQHGTGGKKQRKLTITSVAAKALSSLSLNSNPRPSRGSSTKKHRHSAANMQLQQQAQQTTHNQHPQSQHQAQAQAQAQSQEQPLAQGGGIPLAGSKRPPQEPSGIETLCCAATSSSSSSHPLMEGDESHPKAPAQKKPNTSALLNLLNSHPKPALTLASSVVVNNPLTSSGAFSGNHYSPGEGSVPFNKLVVDTTNPAVVQIHTPPQQVHHPTPLARHPTHYGGIPDSRRADLPHYAYQRCLLEKRGCVEDIDEGDWADSIFVTDYVCEVMDYTMTKQILDRVDPNYMSRQPHINERMREILIDWLSAVHAKFKLLPETLFLSIYIIDKFLSCRPVQRPDLQLLGITALLIASKFEEIFAIEIQDLIVISESAYSRHMIVQMEQEVLSVLQFNLAVPSPLFFLRRFSKASHAESDQHTYSKYLVEMSTLDYGLLQYTPSQVAAAAVYLTRRVFHLPHSWNDTLQYHTCHSETEIIPIARALVATVRKYTCTVDAAGIGKAIFKKYSSPRFFEVSTLAIPSDL
ncbi:B-type cyclin [Pelomyxa schiedti]|nr:B-type cyclin [Pelomyxa schiedti]